MAKRNVSQHFLNALSIGGLDYRDRTYIEQFDSEDNLHSTRKALESAYHRFPSGKWIANVTGGTKPMSIATYEFFKNVGGKIVYTSRNRPDETIDLISGVTEHYSHPLHIKEFLAGYGFEFRKPNSKVAEAETRAQKWIASARLLARHARDSSVLPSSSSDPDSQRKRRQGTEELSKDHFHFPCDRLYEIWLGSASHRKLDKYEYQFLTGGWLEVFFWNLLREHAASLGISDVRLGITVGRYNDKSSENEFDVSFMHNYGLSVMECKSGSQHQDPNADVLHKVEAVTRQFGALRVRSFLVTTSGNVFDKDQQIKSSLRSRSEIYKCTIITVNDIIELAGESVTPELIRNKLGITN